MIPQQTGAELIQNYSQALLPQLRHTAELYGLDTAETEVLIQWASMETANHSRSILELRQTLLSGSKDLEMTTHRRGFTYAIMAAILQAMPAVRNAAVVESPEKPNKVIIYLAR